VGDQPLSQKKQMRSLCFCWPGTGHVQCVTCVQNERKKIRKKWLAVFQVLDREGSSVLKKELEQTVREERNSVFT
jgi:hypothetical protein